MALLDFFGFDHLQASTAPDPALYPNCSQSTASGWTTGTGLLGGKSLRSNSVARNFHWDKGVNYSTLIAAVRFQTNSVAASAVQDILVFYDGASIQCGISINAVGKLIFWRGTNATVIATGTTTLSPNSWYFLEAKVTFHNTTGAYEIRLGGTSEMSGSGANTRNTANNQASGIRWISNAATTTMTMFDIDDIYIEDTSGSAPYADFLGVIRVETAFVTTNDSVQWTPLSSTNASNVDEVQVDDDTTYNSDATAGHIDLFNHGALSSTPVTIFSVAIRSRARKDDVTARTYRNKLKSSTTVSNGATATLDTTYKWIRDQFDTDPNTAAAWATASAVNNSKIGYEVVS
ncbi:hypothetical protein [Mesorhizobium sp. B2-8-9]|uniref:hypothetical protein n=1 Tax=Mesorhizobium sp. B2-8-9 TaxID=2589899 RepID=UPI00112E247C|nr:hypothetical protein [Mesorhizobium sp. B2-8-9]TPI86370.1 hypothetical protein FJ423_00675 [Mesorhizobium sp. B2-8-9]